MNRTKNFGLSLLALLCCIVVTAQTTSVTKCEYWIDQQFDSRQTANMSAGELTTQFDMSVLPLGLHSLAIRTGTGDGRWSPVLVKYFLVPQPGSTQENNLASYEYWIDGNYDNKVTGTFSTGGIVTTDLDMSSLPVGLHSISFRALDDNGHVSSVLVKYFLVPQPGSTQENTLAGYEYWIDSNYDNKVTGTFSTGGIVTTDLDMSSLPVGLHSIAFRALDDNGHVSSVLVKYFLVPENTSTTENSIAGYRYWFDRDMENIVEGEMTSGTIVTDIDVSALNAGLHFFNYQVKDAIGKYSATMVSFFTVPEQGGLGDKIVSYEYWFDDNPRKKVEVEPTMTLELNNEMLVVEGIKSKIVPADYTFDAENKKVIFTQDVEFGLQVFNDLGTGSEAVTQTVEGYEFTVDPAFVALDNEVSDTKAAPKGGDVQGFSYAGAVDDSLHWEITNEVGAKVDFYDAAGNVITPEAKTIDEKDVLVMKMPTESVYVLVYGATQDGDITIKVAQPIELAVIDATRAYGEENPTFTYSTNGATVAGEVAFTTEATAASGVGEYTVSIDDSGITNSYVTLKSGKLTITKAPLTIKAKDYTIKQGEALPTFEMEYEGFKNGETAEVLTTQATIATTATSASEPGTYDITVSGAEAANYELTFVKGTLTIAAADPVTITAKSYEIEYGDELPTFEFTSEGAALVGTPAITCDIPEGAPAGTYPIVISKGNVTNYNDTYVNGTLTITKAKLTITADDIEVHQDEVMPTLTWKAEGWKNDEDESVLTVQPVCTTEGSPTSSLGDYTITIGGAEAANYDITYVNGKLTVSVPVGITSIDANVAPADIYTLQGIKVRSKSESLDGLADGYYIVNRRKVLIRRR